MEAVVLVMNFRDFEITSFIPVVEEVILKIKEAKMRPCVYLSDVVGDGNGLMRTASRLCAVGGSQFQLASQVYVRNEFEGLINLVDALDSFGHRAGGVVLVNIAPRGEKTRYENGSPFCSFSWGGSEIFATLEGDLIPNFLQVVGQKKIQVDVHEINPKVLSALGLPKYRWKHTITTQFRSYEYLPYLAAGVLAGKWSSTEKIWVCAGSEKYARVGLVDGFGNIKLTKTLGQLGVKIGWSVSLKAVGGRLTLKVYQRLKDVPQGEMAMVVGSSGVFSGRRNVRFAEIVLQGGSAAQKIGEVFGKEVASGMVLEV